MPKIPDIPKFSGEKDDEDYDKWRRLAVAKCETYDDTYRVTYLENFITGEAWALVKNIRATSYLDLLEALDPFYADTSLEKLSKAQSDMTNGTLMTQKYGESFSSWKARFMSVCSILSSDAQAAFPDSLLLTYARQYMRHGLASATSHGSAPGETLALFLRRAQEQDRYNTEIGSRKEKATVKAAATPRGRAPAAAPIKVTRNEPPRHNQRKVTAGRTREQRNKLDVANRCFKCGRAGHRSNQPDAPCKGKDWTDTKDIPFLNAMGLDFDDESLAGSESDNEELDEDELVDEDGSPISQDF